MYRYTITTYQPIEDVKEEYVLTTNAWRDRAYPDDDPDDDVTYAVASIRPQVFDLDRARYILAVITARRNGYLPEVVSAEFEADVDSIRAEYNAVVGKNGIGFDEASQIAYANFMLRVMERPA